MTRKKKMTKKRAAPSTTLADFAIAKRRAIRRAACAVCALPDDIRDQLRTARDKKILLPTIIQWLSSIGYKIGVSVYAAHGAGHHDRQNGDMA